MYFSHRASLSAISSTFRFLRRHNSYVITSNYLYELHIALFSRMEPKSVFVISIKFVIRMFVIAHVYYISEFYDKCERIVYL